MMFNNVNLIIRIVIAILTFITSGLLIWLLLRYVVFTTYAIQDVNHNLELAIVRGHLPNLNSGGMNLVANIISRVNSPNSVDIASIVSNVNSTNSVHIANIISSISSNIALDSGINDVISNSPVPSSNRPFSIVSTIQSTAQSLFNHSINPDTNTFIGATFHRRVIIATIVGLGVFVGINVNVDLYLFVATPCC